MSLEYLNVCRLCAGSCERFIPIFEKTGELNFAEKIKTYLHVEIKYSKDACTEPRMCNICYQKLINWDQYAEQVHKVQGMFMSLGTIKESCKTIETLNEEVISMNKKDNPASALAENSVIKELISAENVTARETTFKEKKKEKRRSVKTKKILASNESDFSDEDDIPLANHVGVSTGKLKSRIKGKDTTKKKPRIKLKMRPFKAKEYTTDNENLKEDNACSNIAPKNVQKNEEENARNSLEDDEDDPKDENGIELDGLQSLFTWECLECRAPVKNWNALVKHCKEIHDSNASIQCVCGKFLQSRASIMKHRMKHTIGYGYKCDFENCNKTFHRQQLLDVHSLSHMPKELQPWMCCKCSRRFHTESLLKQHEKVHLPKEEKLIHPCEVCQKKFCSKSAVSAHIRAVHFGERPFVCDQCGHSFTSKGILHEHLTIHSDVYNFHCKDCNKSFKTKYRLKIHMDTHVETRYQCPICTLTLNTRRTLRMHLLVHREDKAFQCTTCGKAFKRSKDLKNHYNLHTGRRPYTCPFCQRTFANGSNCRSHKRRMHPEELKMYEAALAAGQQPIIFRVDDQSTNEKIGNAQIQAGPEFVEDSNESKSDISDLKCDNPKYSDDDAKSVSSVSFNMKSANIECVTNMGNESNDKFKLYNSGSLPLNLQRSNNKRIKEKDDGIINGEELVETIGVSGGENIAPNFSQISFNNQQQQQSANVQYPIHNFYMFQSSGIPAFPGNPFFRQ